MFDEELNYAKLLQGYYEAEYVPKDYYPERVVPDYAFNILNMLGSLYRPVVDEDYLARGGEKPVWPEGKPFAVCLTHDVDDVTLYSLRQSARKRFYTYDHGRALKSRVRSCMAFGLDIVRACKYVTAQDPLHSYERWLKVEQGFNARSTFFFWPGWSSVRKHHPLDCTFELTDFIVFDDQKCTVADMIREIDHRGWEIGLHPSWYSFNDPDELKRQKQALEDVLQHEISSIRQHRLHYDIRVTPGIQAKAGFKYDSTLGFNDNIGFRFGTCYPWNIYDLATGEKLPIKEIPLIIQDGAMLKQNKGMRLDDDTACKYIKQIAGVIEKVGGVLTLLWHPDKIIKQDWWNVYLKALDYLHGKNAWFASVGQIGRWCEGFDDGRKRPGV